MIVVFPDHNYIILFYVKQIINKIENARFRMEPSLFESSRDCYTGAIFSFFGQKNDDTELIK